MCAEVGLLLIVRCRWLAPEVLAGVRPSKASDVFAFGIILWGESHWKGVGMGECGLGGAELGLHERCTGPGVLAWLLRSPTVVSAARRCAWKSPAAVDAPLAPLPASTHASWERLLAGRAGQSACRPCCACFC